MNTLLTIIGLAAIIYFFIVPSFKTRVMPIKKLIFLPVIFMYLNYDSIKHHFHVLPSDTIGLIVAIVIGTVIGVICRYHLAIRVDREKELIEIQRSYFSLILFIVIFCAHFAIGWMESVKPGYLLLQNATSDFLMFFLTASSSVSIGANGILFYRYKKMPSVPLTESN